MKNRYLIALDMDGTLLDDNKIISPATITYLRSLAEQGHIIVLASGRPLRTLEPYHKLIGLDTPMVSYNGSYIVSNTNDNFPNFMFRFPREHILNIITKMGKGTILNAMVETLENVWLYKEDHLLQSFFAAEYGNFIYGDLYQTLDQNPMTLIVELKDTSEKTKLRILKSVRDYENYEIRFWHSSNYAELFEISMTKRDGLKYIANYYQIDHKHTIAFGDANNDIQMLDWAEIGVAMSNGIDSAKQHADFESVADNNNDGVMKTLKKIFAAIENGD